MPKKFKEDVYHGEYLYNYEKVRISGFNGKENEGEVKFSPRNNFGIFYTYGKIGELSIMDKPVILRKNCYAICDMEAQTGMSFGDRYDGIAIDFKSTLFGMRTLKTNDDLFKYISDINEMAKIEIPHCLMLNDDTGEIGRLVKDAQSEYFNRGALYLRTIKNYIQNILILSLRKIPAFDKYNIYSDLVQFILDYINDNYKSKITLSDLAEKLNYNPSYLATEFKRNVGYTFSEYLQRRRVYIASEVLTSTKMTSGEIAAAVGYSDVKYFTGIFEKYVGFTPMQYRKYINEKIKWFPESDG